MTMVNLFWDENLYPWDNKPKYASLALDFLPKRGSDECCDIEPFVSIFTGSPSSWDANSSETIHQFEWKWSSLCSRYAEGQVSEGLPGQVAYMISLSIFLVITKIKEINFFLCIPCL